jgi:hypothetical protein
MVNGEWAERFRLSPAPRPQVGKQRGGGGPRFAEGFAKAQGAAGNAIRPTLRTNG